MVGKIPAYAFGVCENYAKTQVDWDWVKSHRGFRHKIFKHTHLYVGPGRMFKRAGISLDTTSAYVKIYNQYFSKVTKAIFSHPRFLHSYTIHSYYQRVKNIPIGQQPNYAHMVPEINEIYRNSRVEYQLLTAFPDVLGHVFEKGKAIFDEQLDYSSEIALLQSALISKEAMSYSHSGWTGQSILRLMLGQDGDDMLNAYQDTYPDSSMVSETVETIKQRADDIRAKSPYT